MLRPNDCKNSWNYAPLAFRCKCWGDLPSSCKFPVSGVSGVKVRFFPHSGPAASHPPTDSPTGLFSFPPYLHLSYPLWCGLVSMFKCGESLLPFSGLFTLRCYFLVVFVRWGELRLLLLHHLPQKSDTSLILNILGEKSKEFHLQPLKSRPFRLAEMETYWTQLKYQRTMLKEEWPEKKKYKSPVIVGLRR